MFSPSAFRPFLLLHFYISHINTVRSCALQPLTGKIYGEFNMKVGITLETHKYMELTRFSLVDFSRLLWSI